MQLPVEHDLDLAEPIETEIVGCRRKCEVLIYRLLTVIYLQVYYYLMPFVMMVFYSSGKDFNIYGSR